MTRKSKRSLAQAQLDHVPPHQWGITKAQLEEFVEVVRHCQSVGLLRNIPPSDLSEYDPLPPYQRQEIDDYEHDHSCQSCWKSWDCMACCKGLPKAIFFCPLFCPLSFLNCDVGLLRLWCNQEDDNSLSSSCASWDWVSCLKGLPKAILMCPVLCPLSYLTCAFGHKDNNNCELRIWCNQPNSAPNNCSECQNSGRFAGRKRPEIPPGSDPLENYRKATDAKFRNPNIGPTIYQVNEQVIKPLTKGWMIPPRRWIIPSLRRGHSWRQLSSNGALEKSSWALMKNPSGQTVDLFVSHTWAEGIYEFADHLLSVWPDECHAAYICFLSNPQHLDINQLVGDGDITQSPFCKVLESKHTKQVALIATQNTPIHTRIWCCYEAYLAMKHDIPIVIGGDKNWLSIAQGRLAEFSARCARNHEIRQDRLRDDVRVLNRQQLPRLLAAIVNPFFLLDPDFRGKVTGSRAKELQKQFDEQEEQIKQEEEEKEEEIASVVVDVRRARSSNERDRVAILEAIGDEADHVNAMLTRLILGRGGIDDEVPGEEENSGYLTCSEYDSANESMMTAEIPRDDLSSAE